MKAAVILFQPCDSSQIAAWGYDAEAKVLGIQFHASRGGGAEPSVYHYADVPLEVADAFAAAPSKGKFFGASIKGKFAYERQPGADGVVYGLSQAQEPKYTTSSKHGRLVNRDTGTAIPDDEPVFVFRAQDRKALQALRVYALSVEQPDHAAVVARRVADFEAFAMNHPDRMKEPDSPLKLVAAGETAEA
jgi:hypothetical protein